MPPGIIGPKIERLPKPLPEKPTPGEVQQYFAGIRKRARKRKIPKLRRGERSRKLGSFKTRSAQMIGERLARTDILGKIRGLKRGTKIRIRVKGTTSEGVIVDNKLRARVFPLPGGAKQNMNMLLHWLIRGIGSEVLSERRDRRTDEFFDPEDDLEWTVELVA
jgi:hypothetical protein